MTNGADRNVVDQLKALVEFLDAVQGCVLVSESSPTEAPKPIPGKPKEQQPSFIAAQDVIKIKKELEGAIKNFQLWVDYVNSNFKIGGTKTKAFLADFKKIADSNQIHFDPETHDNLYTVGNKELMACLNENTHYEEVPFHERGHTKVSSTGGLLTVKSTSTKSGASLNSVKKPPSSASGASVNSAKKGAAKPLTPAKK